MKKNKCFIIAEIGNNFTNFSQAKKLINLAVKAKVDAVKLQTFNADTLSSKHAMFDMKNTGKVSQYNLFKKYQINENLHQKIFIYCKKKKLNAFLLLHTPKMSIYWRNLMLIIIKLALTMQLIFLF